MIDDFEDFDIAGHLSEIVKAGPPERHKLRKYTRQNYSPELDKDQIIMEYAVER